MIKQNKMNRKNINNKYRILFFYLLYIKPYSDKIPFFREIAKRFWLVNWKISLKIKSIMQSIDLGKVYWINPKKIEYSLDENWHYLPKNFTCADNDKKNVHNWDLPGNLIKFEERQSYEGYYQHFIEGKKWTETKFYQSVLDQMESGKFKWGCSSEEEFIKRCRQLDELYKDIENNGLKTQKILGNGEKLKHRGIREVRDEISIAIGRDGDLIHYDGQNRLAIAKILNLNQVPVKIYRRHKKWMKFRKKLFHYVKKEMNGRALEPLLHPDFSGIPSFWENRRFEMIKKNISIKKGTLLDIGAHWGYFCHKFEEMGYYCTAFEENSENRYFLKKLKRAGNMNFKVIDQSIYDFKDNLHFDIVLMLNLSHYLFEKKERYDQLVKLLRKMKTNKIYLQINTPLEMKEGSVHRNCFREDIINVILKNANLKNLDCIGEIKESKIFKLYC